MATSRWIALSVVIVLALGGYTAWSRLTPREGTDDAQVSGHVNPVATRVGGTVVAIKVTDNQAVKAGDVLVELDPRDYQLAVARAEADLAVAEAAARAAKTDVPITSTSARSGQQVADAAAGNADAGLRAADREVEAAQAKVTSARARLTETQARATRAAQDLSRLAPLAAKDEIPRQQFDAATADKHAADAAVASADAAVREAEANLSVAEARRAQATGVVAQAQSQARAAATAPQQIALSEARASGATANVLLARAALDQARLNLERATVRAPADGLISRKSVELGQVVQPGQPLMAVTSLEDVWITANFKETQLSRIAAGQRAEIEVDAYGGRTYSGRVDSIAPATGATFSLLPPDNATGNFVKVVQRVPVKIVLDNPHDAAAVLRPGMSVNATVYFR
ncbi:MAG TPA: HlyD family secretion protein [Vicinamibacterales bacterium]|nr:HlyD family secretion protein [Vicinamibacterales bacterium]